MADGLLKWAKSRHKDWTQEIELIERGYKTTAETRNGKRVDTTQETLADDTKVRLSALEALISKHDKG
jgi:hypothetical protein